jgi:glycerophosphoryl diester phosphodiesterase
LVEVVKMSSALVQLGKRIAHRGAGCYKRENTMDAFQWAVDNRVDGIELDVFVAADGEVVVNHNPEVRVGAGTLEVATASTAELWAAAAVPTLRMVLDLLIPSPLEIIVVELKGDNTPHPVGRLFGEMAARYGQERVESCLRVSGFHHDVIDEFGRLPAWHRIPRAYTDDLFSEQLLERAAAHGITDLHLHQGHCTAATTAQIHARGLKLMVWTSGTIAESGMLCLFSFGCFFLLLLLLCEDSSEMTHSLTI